MNILAAIGHTPLVRLNRIAEGCSAVLAAKLEGFNPGGSVKDRAALFMIDAAERQGILKPGGAIIEPTSGNTGIGLAVVASRRGYTLIAVMPDSMSIERRRILASYGARVVLTPGAQGMTGAVTEARRLVEETEGSFMPMQFDNPANVEAHRKTTGPEIWEETSGRVDGIVCGVGTGGTISGIGEILKEKRRDIRVIAVEPMESAVLSGRPAGRHSIQGIGAGFVPKILNRSVIDEIVPISSEEARATTLLLARTEGIFAGISSGAALAAALRVARRPENSHKLFVVVFPDRGENYLSTGLWE
ncbi:MAG: cysteine synthase A [Candidatus Krumholzibacteria bacterium]|nr:cysteine synthase A [Candidatus Krumholzibacteria bacterium]